MKRIFDLALALLLALPAGAAVAVCVLLIRAQSPGPGIFRQARIGRHGTEFICYKLRTMKAGTANLPSHESSADAVTRAGAFLRRTKLDELPQLWNILRGEMSFVGPRPCLPSQRELIGARQALGVLTIRPGITGLAQVQGIDMSEPQRLAAVDAQYMRDMRPTRDIALMARTLLGAGRGDRTRPPAAH
jgi:O-antigen biosynthesis protein WbqP